MIKSVDWLEAHLADDDLIILDASLPQKLVRKVQIPGSKHFDLKNKFSDTSSTFPNMMPSPKQFEEEARKLGINRNSTIVIYDNIGIYVSPRAWYMFRSMGHSDVYVLDGGLPEWQRLEFPVEEVSESKTEHGNFVAVFDPNFFKNIEDIHDNIKSEEASLVDARSEGRFEGLAPEPRAELRSGNIPGSENIPYTDVLIESKFKPVEELSKIFQTSNRPKIFTCGSGVTACILLLASEIAQDQSEKAIYDGSWTEWAITNGYVK